MINHVMIGTLSTFTSVLTPLGAGVPTDRQDYHLVASDPASCPDSKRPLGVKIEPQGEQDVKLEVSGQACGSPGLKTVNFSIVLPVHLLDAEFLQHLPEHASFVVSGVGEFEDESERAEQAAPSLTAGAKVKVTRGSHSGPLSPLLIEWLPDRDGHVLHPPMIVWIGHSHLNRNFPWEKIQFTELTSKKNGETGIYTFTAPVATAKNGRRTVK